MATNSNKGRDPLRAWLLGQRAIICNCDHCFEQRVESPIEMMMQNALAFCVLSGRCGMTEWAYHQQWPVLGYTADFVILSEYFQMVIECDGHDFHERTKEQAARDRKRDRGMAAAGWTVLRYTGSEIWKNPFACAEQILDMAMSRHVDAELALERLTNR